MKKPLSQFDMGETLKSAHEDTNQSFRVHNANSSVPQAYSRVDLTYNGSGSVTNAKFYEGKPAEEREILFIDDISGSLNNTYFTLYSAYDIAKYYVWYNVSGAGTDPAIANATGIEVPLLANDPASIIAYATELSLSKIVDFKISRVADTKLKIVNIEPGITTNSVDFGTGFTIVTIQQGSEVLIKNIDIPYTGDVKYLFNEQEKFFTVTAAALGTISVDLDADSGDNIAISRHENPRNILNNNTYIDTDLDTTTFTEILSYTAIEDLRIKVIKINADTLGTFRVLVEGVIQDYFRTSSEQRNGYFFFTEDLDALTGEEITIEFKPERIRLPSYDFFYRFEGYVQ